MNLVFRPDIRTIIFNTELKEAMIEYFLLFNSMEHFVMNLYENVMKNIM